MGKFGWHSGKLRVKDIEVLNDLTIQDDLIFGDVSAGALSVTGGIDLSSSTATYGIDFNGATISTADIRMENGETIDNGTDGTIKLTCGTELVQPGAAGTVVIKLASDANAYTTLTQSDGGAVVIATVSDGTAGITLDGGIVTLDNGATLDNTASATTLAVTEATISLVGATKINLDGATDVTGILTVDTAGSPADGIKINATTPTDGLEVASVCTNAINLSGANAVGLSISGANTTAGIDITATGSLGRAIRIGKKDGGGGADGSVQIRTGASVDAEPANNYLFGLFSKVAAAESTATDELRGAWIRTRVNDGCHVGTGSGYGFGVCGSEIQLKIYATAAATNMYSWQNSAIWAQLETQGASGINFKSGSHTQAILANVGLTSTTTIDSGAVVAGITVNTNTSASNVTATGGFYGIHITDITPSHLDFQDAIHIDAGVCTQGIKFDGGGSYNPIVIGTKSNSADAGLILTGVTDDTGGIMVFCDDGNDTLSSVTSPIWTRYLITKNQGTGGPTATGAYVQTKTLTGLTFTTGSYTALKAYMQVGGTLVTDSASTEIAIMNAGITFEGDYTCTSGTLSGIDININDGTHTIGTHTGLIIRKTSSSTAGWTTGISIPAGGAVTGISIGSCTTGISVSGTGGAASSKAFSTSGWTINNANLTDGYGTVEADLTLTGTVAGHVSALSSWVNMGTVTTGGNYVCAQTNGLWSDTGGVLTNGVFIFGMRAQCLLQTNGGVSGAKFYPFSVVNNTNVTTAIFKCNAGSSDLGTTAVSKSSESKYVPFYEDDAGVHYVLIYN